MQPIQCAAVAASTAAAICPAGTACDCERLPLLFVCTHLLAAPMAVPADLPERRRVFFELFAKPSWDGTEKALATKLVRALVKEGKIPSKSECKRKGMCRGYPFSEPRRAIWLGKGREASRKRADLQQDVEDGESSGTGDEVPAPAAREERQTGRKRGRREDPEPEAPLRTSDVQKIVQGEMKALKSEIIDLLSARDAARSATTTKRRAVRDPAGGFRPAKTALDAEVDAILDEEDADLEQEDEDDQDETGQYHPPASGNGGSAVAVSAATIALRPESWPQYLRASRSAAARQQAVDTLVGAIHRAARADQLKEKAEFDADMAAATALLSAAAARDADTPADLAAMRAAGVKVASYRVTTDFQNPKARTAFLSRMAATADLDPEMIAAADALPAELKQPPKKGTGGNGKRKRGGRGNRNKNNNNNKGNDNKGNDKSGKKGKSEQDS